MDIQKMFDELWHLQMEQRSRYHLTYGNLIDACRNAPPGTKLAGEYVGISSYRGFYEDIAICTEIPQLKFPENSDCHDLATWLQNQMGTELWGYKGGDYAISPNKPLWIAADSGNRSDLAVMSINQADGYLVLSTRVIQ